MSIKVQEVTKLYGHQKALDKVTFDISNGEIAGLLGPNGAGKSTMMKIIAGYLSQTSGNIEIQGMNTLKSSLEIRRLIGYLPENNPLYDDMYVREYLLYVANLYKLGSRKSRQVNQAIEFTGLEPERHKKIAALSKGYRQRVGLAQALIHDPKILILDEPTTGLDPNQLIEIRNLIREVGRNKTVILSTHIMQEVEAVCDRVIVIHQGKLAADCNMEEITCLQTNALEVEVEFASQIDVSVLKKLHSVSSVRKLGENRYVIATSIQEDIRPDVFRFAVENEYTLLEMVPRRKNLEHIFRELTDQNK